MPLRTSYVLWAMGSMLRTSSSLYRKSMRNGLARPVRWYAFHRYTASSPVTYSTSLARPMPICLSMLFSPPVHPARRQACLRS